MSLIKYNSMMRTKSRQYIVSTSIRSLASNIAAVAYSYLTHRSDKWMEYKQVNEGTNEFIDVIQILTVLTLNQ